MRCAEPPGEQTIRGTTPYSPGNSDDVGTILYCPGAGVCFWIATRSSRKLEYTSRSAAGLECAFLLPLRRAQKAIRIDQR